MGLYSKHSFYDSRKTDLTAEQRCLSLVIKVKPTLKTLHVDAATNCNNKVFHFLHV